MAILDIIKDLKNVNTLTKHERIIKGVRSAIQDEEIGHGEFLPSVNEMSTELGFARETIVKAYNNLKDRGIINSKRGVGFYVNTLDVDQKLSVALLMYSFHDFQQSFYNTFRDNLGENVHVEVFFHHNNRLMYESILSNINGKYAIYVVAPIHGIDIRSYLANIPTNRLLIVDRYEDFGDEYSYISQEFEDSSFKVFRLLQKEFRAYQEVVLFFDETLDHPIGVQLGFEKFLKECGISGRIEKSYKHNSVKANTAYITIGDHDLWELLKDCHQQNLELGKDVGILSSNDAPMKEFISGGISTYYADFEDMAKRSVEFVKSQELVQKIMPVKLIRRKSL